MIATWGFFATLGLRVISCTAMAFSSVLKSRDERVGVRWKQLLDRDGALEDLLLARARDRFLEHRAVGGDSVGQGILARDLHDAPVRLVDGRRFFDCSGAQPLDVEALRLAEGG